MTLVTGGSARWRALAVTGVHHTLMRATFTARCACIASRRCPVAAISVRDLDETVAGLLKVRAARHGRSMEAEVRAILTDAVTRERQDRHNLAQALRERIAPIGGVDLEIPRRNEMPRAAELSDLS
jgi:plasmid stability protein